MRNSFFFAPCCKQFLHVFLFRLLFCFYPVLISLPPSSVFGGHSARQTLGILFSGGTVPARPWEYCRCSGGTVPARPWEYCRCSGGTVPARPWEYCRCSGGTVPARPWEYCRCSGGTVPVRPWVYCQCIFMFK